MRAAHARFLGLVLMALGGLGAAGCTRGGLVTTAMNGSPHATSARGLRVGDRMILAGDMHCHVSPPDTPREVSRDLSATLALANEEALDFLVLTPHVLGRFFLDEEKRAWLDATQRELRAQIESLHPSILVIPGFEYTDRRYGHVGMSFADPSEVMAALPLEDSQVAPERFFELWVQRGGILTINHPASRPLRGVPFRELSYDLSWRAFWGASVPSEVAWISAHAQAIEAFNNTVTELRDLFLVGDEDRSLRETMHLADQVARTQHRKIAAVGGSDSHGDWLRASTFVLAKERSIESLRSGIAGARTCVRGPEACTLEVRPQGGNRAWLGVGDALTMSEHEGYVPFEGRATGDDVTFVVDGAVAARVASGEVATFPVPVDRCSVIRAVVGRSWSSGIYVNCIQ